MWQRNGLFLGLLLVASGLLIYDIGLRSSGSSVAMNAIEKLTNPMQKTAAAPPSVPALPRKECDMSTATPTFDQYFDFIEEASPCGSMTIFGGIHKNPKADGAKVMCMDPKFAPAKKFCTVLSFGINNEWSFDDAMEAQGCRVYAFDPTMGAKDHTRGKDILFFNLGLSNSNKNITLRKKNVPVASLRSILTRFALLGTDIDYLKIDIEGSEIDVFQNVLREDPEILTRIKQIGMEIHHGQLEARRRNIYWRDIHELRCLGFRQVSSEPNLAGGNPFLYGSRKVSRCYELVWINEAYL